MLLLQQVQSHCENFCQKCMQEEKRLIEHIANDFHKQTPFRQKEFPGESLTEEFKPKVLDKIEFENRKSNSTNSSTFSHLGLSRFQ